MSKTLQTYLRGAVKHAQAKKDRKIVRTVELLKQAQQLPYPDLEPNFADKLESLMNKPTGKSIGTVGGAGVGALASPGAYRFARGLVNKPIDAARVAATDPTLSARLTPRLWGSLRQSHIGRALSPKYKLTILKAKLAKLFKVTPLPAMARTHTGASVPWAKALKMSKGFSRLARKGPMGVAAGSLAALLPIIALGLAGRRAGKRVDMARRPPTLLERLFGKRR